MRHNNWRLIPVAAQKKKKKEKKKETSFKQKKKERRGIKVKDSWPMEITQQQVNKWSQSMPNTFLIGFTNEFIAQNNNNNKIWSEKENH